jgi:hypothetical protein
MGPLKEFQALVKQVFYSYHNPTNSFLSVVQEGVLNSNNDAEVQAATILTTLAMKEGLGQLQILGDYKPIISWMEGSLQASNLNLHSAAHRC